MGPQLLLWLQPGLCWLWGHIQSLAATPGRGRTHRYGPQHSHHRSLADCSIENKATEIPFHHPWIHLEKRGPSSTRDTKSIPRYPATITGPNRRSSILLRDLGGYFTPGKHCAKQPFLWNVSTTNQLLPWAKNDWIKPHSFLFSAVGYSVEVDCNRTWQNPNAFNFTYPLLRSVYIWNHGKLTWVKGTCSHLLIQK